MFELFLIVMALTVVGCLFIPKDKLPPAKPRRRRRRSSYDAYGKPHGLPWMDPDYQKWLERQKRRNSNKLNF